MARLRKASPLEPSIFPQQSDHNRQRRSSPRKAVREISYIISSDEDEENIPLRPKPSKRDLSDQSSFFQDDSFYTCVSYATPKGLTLTPRKQRILRPVESNSRLLRKLSDESLASPEKRLGSERRIGRDRKESAKTATGRNENFMYAKSLVRSVAERDLKRISSRVDVLGNTKQCQQRARQEKTVVAAEVHEIEADSEEETSVLCGNEADVAQEVKEQEVDINECEGSTSEEPQEESDEVEDDEDVVLPVRSRQGQIRRCIESDSESEYEEERQAEVKDADVKQNPEEMHTEAPQSLMSMRPPHRKGHSTISNWAQEVIDLTDSPQAQESFVLPESTRARSSSFAISRPATSSSDNAHPFLT